MPGVFHAWSSDSSRPEARLLSPSDALDADQTPRVEPSGRILIALSAKRIGAVVVTENARDFSLIRKYVSFAFVAM